MKTEFNTSSNKDNVTTAAVLAVSLFALASGLFNSNPAAANRALDTAMQKMDTIVVRASRAPDFTLETMVVTAPRKVAHV